MCVVNKQFELLEFVFDTVYVDLQYDKDLSHFYCWVCVCSHVVVFGMSVRLSWYPMEIMEEACSSRSLQVIKS